MSPSNEIKEQGTSPSKSPSHVENCGLLPHPVETTYRSYRGSYSVLVCEKSLAYLTILITVHNHCNVVFFEEVPTPYAEFFHSTTKTKQNGIMLKTNGIIQLIVKNVNGIIGIFEDISTFYFFNLLALY